MGRAISMFELLQEILQAPDSESLEEFLSRVPSVFSVVILSIHGYFGQADVLGKPDTGGQVVYILDQVKALESEMLLRISNAGATFLWCSFIRFIVVNQCFFSCRYIRYVTSSFIPF